MMSEKNIQELLKELSSYTVHREGCAWLHQPVGDRDPLTGWTSVVYVPCSCGLHDVQDAINKIFFPDGPALGGSDPS